MDELKIAARLRKKDEKALAETIKEFSPLAATIIWNISKGTMSKEDIEEVMSDVFITLWNNTDKIIDDKLKGYICCIAKTKALNKLSTIKTNVVNIEDYDFEDDFSIEAETESKDIVNELKELIEAIPEPDKEILMRYYFYYQSAPKIGKDMDFNQETIKYRLKRTREKLKTLLLERGYFL